MPAISSALGLHTLFHEVSIGISNFFYLNVPARGVPVDWPQVSNQMQVLELSIHPTVGDCWPWSTSYNSWLRKHVP